MTASGHAFSIVAFGCQMNRHDSEALTGLLLREGYRRADSPEAADILLYFTCSVRDNAENRVWSHLGCLRERKRSGSLKALGVIGCMSERLGDGLRRKMPHVDLVVGPRRIAEVPSLLATALESGGHAVRTGEQDGAETDCCIDPSLAERPNAFQAMLPVIRGCDCWCSYCVVPSVRGGETSVPPDEVERSARRLVDDGAIEITLIGQNIDRYGKKLSPRADLAGLLRRLAQIPGLRRLRFATSHPRDITPELLETMAEFEVVCPYLHVPAQSGSDRVLSAMNRGYDRARYLEVAEMARRLVPGIELASDFIVGYPGETDADFEDTLSLAWEVAFQNSFIFKYSPRPGTAAARLEDDVPEDVKRDRHRALTNLQHGISLRRNQEMIGKTVEVLCEGPSPRDPVRLIGRGPTARLVAFESDANPTGRIVRVRVEEATPFVLLGKEFRAEIFSASPDST